MMALLVRRGAGAAVAGLTAAATVRYQSLKKRQERLPSQPLTVFADNNNQIGQQQKTTPNQQEVLILGAGVVGVSTAHKLAQRGHKVVVLEPMTEPGEECSACAAGGMSRQNVVVDKNTWKAVFQCLTIQKLQHHFFKSNNFEFFSISWLQTLSDPLFLKWAWTFTRTSFVPPKDYPQKQQQMLKFTDYAVKDMVQMIQNNNMAEQVGFNPRGSLAVSYTSSDDPGAVAGKEATKQKKDTNTLEPHRMIMMPQEVLELEPSLRFQHARPPVSAKFEYETKAASSGRFTKALAFQCVTDPLLDVTFLYNTKVQGITTTKGSKENLRRISQLHTNRGIISVPEHVHIVVTAGAWTPHVLALMDLYAPVYPLKGYSLSVSAQRALLQNALQPHDLPSRIVCDKYMYTTRLGDEIRITSIGEFNEWDTHPTPSVDANFRREAARQFPQLQEWIHEAKTYCGLRPYVSDGLLLLGAVDKIQNLYVSCGPGSNGWKLACLGSGEVIARLISGQTSLQIKQDLGFDIDAFSPAGRVLHTPLFSKACRARWNV